MVVFPNCKINLGLIITGKRADGYHNLETIFYPVQMRDALEIIHSTDAGDISPMVFTNSGATIAGEDKDNLCIKAWYLIKKDYPRIPPVKIHLHKAIPMGAGLGGGSADAAFALMALNDKFNLHLTHEQLSSYALQLGSDCPFFILNKPCIARGRGEILQPVNINLSGYRLIVANPGIHVSTQWAFSQLNPEDCRLSISHSLQTIISQPISTWRDGLVNNFEKPVFQKYPEIKAIKDAFYEKGALFASMSGSGSSVYAIFDNKSKPTFNFPENYLLRNILL